MTQRDLQQLSKATRRQAVRAYIRERVMGVRKEIKRESESEIRAALRGWIGTAATD